MAGCSQRSFLERRASSPVPAKITKYCFSHLMKFSVGFTYSILLAASCLTAFASNFSATPQF